MTLVGRQNQQMKSHLSRIRECRIKIYPKDIKTVRAFYERILGYHVIQEWNDGEHDQGIMFNLGTTMLELLSSKDASTSIQGVDLSLEVEDVRALWESVKDKTRIIFPLRHNEWSDTSFCIADPEGFELTFFTKD